MKSVNPDLLDRLSALSKEYTALRSHPSVLPVDPRWGNNLKRDTNAPQSYVSDAFETNPPAWYTPRASFPDSFELPDGRTVTKSTTGQYDWPEDFGEHRHATGVTDGQLGGPINPAADVVGIMMDDTAGIRVFGGTRPSHYDMSKQTCNVIGGFTEMDAFDKTFETIVKELIEEGLSGSAVLGENFPAEYGKLHETLSREEKPDAAQLELIAQLDDGKRPNMFYSREGDIRLTGDLGELFYEYARVHKSELIVDIESYMRDTFRPNGVGNVAYDGPVLAGSRNTDTSKIWTTAYAGFVDMEEIDAIAQRHGYGLAEGSDLSEIAAHPIEDFVADAFDDHGKLAALAVENLFKDKVLTPEQAAVVTTQIETACGNLQVEIGRLQTAIGESQAPPHDIKVAANAAAGIVAQTEPTHARMGHAQ